MADWSEWRPLTAGVTRTVVVAGRPGVSQHSRVASAAGKAAKRKAKKTKKAKKEKHAKRTEKSVTSLASQSFPAVTAQEASPRRTSAEKSGSQGKKRLSFYELKRRALREIGELGRASRPARREGTLPLPPHLEAAWPRTSVSSQGDSQREGGSR